MEFGHFLFVFGSGGLCICCILVALGLEEFRRWCRQLGLVVLLLFVKCSCWVESNLLVGIHLGRWLWKEGLIAARMLLAELISRLQLLLLLHLSQISQISLLAL